MNTTQPTTIKYRPINSQQLQLLTAIYKFRLVTAQLIASSQGAKYTRVILTRLKILVDQGYIGQNYDSSYKIIGKPATYYLLPKGIQVLRQQKFADSNVLKQIYYDRNKDDKHITHRLNVFRTYVAIKQQYPNQFQFYSKSELSSWKHIPRDITDAYLKRNPDTASSDLNDKQYFLTYYEPDMPSWRIKNSIRKYIAYAESEKWQKATKRDFPNILMVCDNQQQAKRLQNMSERETDASWTNIKFVPFILNT